MLSTISIYKGSLNNGLVKEYNCEKNSTPHTKTDIFIKDNSKQNTREISDMIATIYGSGKQTIYSPQQKQFELKPYIQKEIYAAKDNSFSELDNKPVDTRYIMSGSNFDAMIHYNNADETFNFFDKRKESLGKFKAIHLINYISSCLDSSYKIPYYNNNDIGCDLVKNFILKNVKAQGDLDVELYDHNDSAFMGDIESLVRLNNHLHKYEEKDLDSYLLSSDQTKKKILKKGIKLVIYKLLIHTLKVISMASGKLSQSGGQTPLKDKLLNYSIGTVYRITKYVQDELNGYIKSNENIDKTLSLCRTLRETLNGKMDGAVSLIKKQNENLIFMAQKMKRYEKSLEHKHKKSYHLEGGHNNSKRHKSHHKHLTTSSGSEYYSSTSESYNDISISSSLMTSRNTTSTESSSSMETTSGSYGSSYENVSTDTSDSTDSTDSTETEDTTTSNEYTENNYLSSSSSDTDYDM